MNHPIIGSRYKETVADLVGRLQASLIPVFKTDAKGKACYFCREPINGPVYELHRQRFPRYTLFFLDEQCYESTKEIH